MRFVACIIAVISKLKSRPAASTRERLLEAAARVIARDGFQGARLADVAREAGLTTGAIYSNFRDKEELFLAAFDQVQGVDSALLPDGSGIEGIVASFRAANARFENSRQLQVLNLELALLGARDGRVRRLLRQATHETLDSVAADLPGDDAPERRRRAAQMIALANGYAIMRMLSPEDFPTQAAELGLRKLAGPS